MINQLISKITHLQNMARWVSQAATLDTIDSPFLFRFANEVVWQAVVDSKIEVIEKRKREFLNDHSKSMLGFYPLAYLRQSRVLGIVSNRLKNKFPTYSKIKLEESGVAKFDRRPVEKGISQIIKSKTANSRGCELIYNTIRFLNPDSILEVGTSLGISTLYLAAAQAKAKIVTLEKNLKLMGLAAHHDLEWANKIEYLNGSNEQSLNHLITQESKFDLIITNSTSEIQSELLSYYNGLSHEKSVWIIGGINQSDQKASEWQKLRGDQHWNVVIDLYFFGVLIYRPEMKERIDVKLLPFRFRWKPGLVRP